MDYPVVIVEYDPQWPQRFEAEKTQILGALHGLVEAQARSAQLLSI